MLGRCLAPVEDWAESDGEQYHRMGKVIPGDRVVWVQKLEGNGNIFTMTSKKFPVFVEDIRLIKFAMKNVMPKSTPRSTHSVIERFELHKEVKAEIVGSMPMALDTETKCNVRETFFK
jgi:hypothetical protein